MSATLRRLSNRASGGARQTCGSGMTSGEIALHSCGSLIAHYKVVTAGPDAVAPLRESVFREGPNGSGRLALLDLARPAARMLTPGNPCPGILPDSGGLGEALEFRGNSHHWFEPEDEPAAALDVAAVNARGLSIAFRAGPAAGVAGGLHFLLGPVAGAPATPADRSPCLALSYTLDGRFYPRWLNSARQELTGATQVKAALAGKPALYLLTLGPLGILCLYLDGVKVCGPAPVPAPLLTDGRFQIGRVGLIPPVPGSQSFDLYEIALILGDLDAKIALRKEVLESLRI